MLKIWRNGQLTAYKPSGGCKNKDQASKAGKTAKKYRLTWKHYREISSAAVVMFENRKNRLTFWTFTTDGRDPYPVCVKFFSKFLDNFKKTYKCEQYIWTGELGDVGKKPHFHMLADVPYLSLAKVTKAYCDARGYYSSSAVRLPKNKEGKTDKSVVTNVGSLVRYICKYMSKSVKSGVDFGGRVYGMSRHLTNAFEVVEYPSLEKEILSSVASSGAWMEIKKEYCTMFAPTKKIEETQEFLDSILNYST